MKGNGFRSQDVANRMRGGERERERAARSVTRGQRDVSMDGRVNERLFVISGVAFMQFFLREGGGRGG